MYATCLFCHASLGANESIEHFPVGRRLAFDAAKGRLWVVCSKCERWNLSPLEERWEAIEEAERVYRDTKKRVATDNIGLARLRDGTDLIRIGEPLRPEFAAWRYGDTFGRRRRRQMMVGVGAAAGLAGALTAVGAGMVAYGASAIAFGVLPQLALQGFTSWRVRGRRVTVRGEDGGSISISAVGMSGALVTLVDSGVDHPRELMLSVMNRDRLHISLPMRFQPTRIAEAYRNSIETIRGVAAMQAMAVVLATTNGMVGTPKNVTGALEILEANAVRPESHSTTEILRSLSPEVRRKTLAHLDVDLPGMFQLSHLPAATRLALEMSLHEDSERRALEGELHELARRWKEAEEIAAISDSLFLPNPSE